MNALRARRREKDVNAFCKFGLRKENVELFLTFFFLKQFFICFKIKILNTSPSAKLITSDIHQTWKRNDTWRCLVTILSFDCLVHAVNSDTMVNVSHVCFFSQCSITWKL